MCISTMIRPAYEVPDQGFKPVYFFAMSLSFFSLLGLFFYSNTYLLVDMYIYWLTGLITSVQWSCYLVGLRVSLESRWNSVVPVRWGFTLIFCLLHKWDSLELYPLQWLSVWFLHLYLCAVALMENPFKASALISFSLGCPKSSFWSSWNSAVTRSSVGP